MYKTLKLKENSLQDTAQSSQLHKQRKTVCSKNLAIIQTQYCQTSMLILKFFTQRKQTNSTSIQLQTDYQGGADGNSTFSVQIILQIGKTKEQCWMLKATKFLGQLAMLGPLVLKKKSRKMVHSNTTFIIAPTILKTIANL